MSKLIDLTGQKFGRLTVIDFAGYRKESDGQNRRYWNCLCDCGTKSVVRGSNLTRKNGIKSCGCLRKEKIKESNSSDITGQKFGRLTVLKRTDKKKFGTYLYLCKCDCGNESLVNRRDLKRTKSCGCLRKERTSEAVRTHGKSNTRLYMIWSAMKSRCYNPHDIAYSTYGAEGKTVCDEWFNSFQAFYNWSMSNGYQDDLTIERIDGAKGYSPDNCEWATRKEQANNRRSNHFVTYKNENYTITELAKKLGVSRTTIRRRLDESGAYYYDDEMLGEYDTQSYT